MILDRAVKQTCLSNELPTITILESTHTGKWEREPKYYTDYTLTYFFGRGRGRAVALGPKRKSAERVQGGPDVGGYGQRGNMLFDLASCPKLSFKFKCCFLVDLQIWFGSSYIQASSCSWTPSASRRVDAFRVEKFFVALYSISAFMGDGEIIKG